MDLDKLKCVIELGSTKINCVIAEESDENIKITPIKLKDMHDNIALNFISAMPTPIRVTPVLNQARNVRSFAKLSRAILPVFSTISDIYYMNIIYF